MTTLERLARRARMARAALWTRIVLATLLAALLAAAAPAWAHAPNLTSVRVIETGDTPMVEVYVPTAGVVAAFAERFDAAPALDSIAGREHLVRYLHDTLALRSPGGDWVLGAGGLRVGGHETVVRLTVTPPDGARLPLDVHAPLFEENAGQRVTVRYIRDEGTDRVALTAANAFSTRIGAPEADPSNVPRVIAAAARFAWLDLAIPGHGHGHGHGHTHPYASSHASVHDHGHGHGHGREHQHQHQH